MLTFKTRHRSKAQSSVELALLIPIFIFLILVCIQLFNAVMTASNESTETYIEKLEQFNHGSGLIFDPLTGAYLPAGEYIEAGSSGLLSFDDMVDSAVAEIIQLGLEALLNFIYDKIGIFQGSTIIGDFSQAFISSAANQAVNSYISSGFESVEVDWGQAAWEGATAGLSSDQATEIFQGSDHTSSSARELFGSALQSGATGFTGSEGDVTAMGEGFVSGMLGSDTFGQWAEEGSNSAQMLKGAARGAIASSASGLFHDNFDVTAVAKSAGLGALQTKAFADVVTGNKFSGDDPRGSLNYGAINAGVSTLIQGGDIKDAAFSAASGAFYSQQVSSAIGDSSWAQAGAGIGFGAVTSLAQGNDFETAGMGALTSAAGFIGGQATGWISSQITSGAENITTTEQATDHAGSVKSEDIAGDPGLDQNQAYQEQYIQDGIIYSTFIDDVTGGTT